MEWMILGHILGDFYFQWDWLAKKKVESWKYLILHGILYSVTIGFFMCMIEKPTIKNGIWLVGILIIHMAIDKVKIWLDKKFEHKKCLFFVIDQFLHVLAMFSFMCVGEICIDSTIFACIKPMYISVLISLLICWKPASIFVALIVQSAQVSDSSENYRGGNVGTLIGKLEREIILLLGISGQFGAIGFVLAAKSLARYKQLEEQSFAEKYLVGTLASTLIAVLCIIGIDRIY